MNNSIKILSELVAINSIFPNEKKLGEYLEKALIERGFKTKRIYISEDRFNVVGERGTKGKPLVFYGHMDTVPVYGNWTNSPFKLVEKGDKLHGLGAVDMKAGIAAILCAVETQTEQKIKVAFGADEENISEGGWAILNDGLLKDALAVVVPEINDDPRSKPRHSNTIMLGRRGRCVYEIHIPGRSSHGAQVDLGISAINEASKLVLELESLNKSMKPHSQLLKPTQFIRKISAESTSLSIPESATLEIDRHLVTPETPESVLAEIESFIDSLYSKGIFKEIDSKRISVKIKERKTPYLPPYVTSENDPTVIRLAKIINSKIGKCDFVYGASVADENVFSISGIPILGYCPIGHQYHSADEWVSKSSYLQIVDVLTEFVKSF